MKRILKLQSSCGDLCNTGKEVKPGEFIGTVKSDASITNSNMININKHQHCKMLKLINEFSKSFHLLNFQVNCKTLVKLVQKFGNEAPQMKPKNWSELPTELQSLYNYNGR